MPAKKIFLASSLELKDDRIAFEIFISRKNNEWYYKGVFLELVIWEDFIDAVSQTRLQDEYNKAIKECDIFLMLFFTKVGKYTEEEFEKAFGQFKETNKPLIYTYFKDADIKTGKITDDILSMLQFRKKLDKLGHFVTVYENIQDLLLRFGEQLNKLDKTGFMQPNQSPALQIFSTPKYPKDLNNRIPKTYPADIIGREKDLEALHELLCNDERVVVVNGLGGIGKTTLVEAYIRKYYKEYNHIAWITQTAGDIANDFINTDGLLKNLEIDTNNIEPAQLFREVIRKMKGIPENPNLLIIDNAEQSLKEYKKMLPDPPPWHLLVTSREEIEDFYPKSIDFLNEEQSIALFKKHYTHKVLSETDLRELVRIVDYHTLTIKMLAKTAQEQYYDVNTLKSAIENDLKANVEVSPQSSEVKKIGAYLSTVFNMSNLEANEIWLMKQFACLPSEFFSHELLNELTAGKESEPRKTSGGTLNTLKKKGWLLYNTEADSYKMLRIIAELVKKQQPISMEDVKNLIEGITDKLGIDQTKDNPVDRFIWIPFGKIIADNFPKDDSVEIAELQNNLALRLRDIGEYRKAKELLEKAVVINENKLGEDHLTTAIKYSNLALLLRDFGDYKSARELLKKAVAINENKLGEDHPTTARNYSNLATVLHDLGDYEEAKSLLEKAVTSDENNFGKNHSSTVIRYANLAAVLKHLGYYEKAKELLERVVAFNRDKFGEEHPNTAMSYSSLATVLQDLHDYKGAKELLEKALVSEEKNFGKDHPTTAFDYWKMAKAISNFGEFKQALEFCQKAIDIYSNTFSLNHPDVKKMNDTYQSIKKKMEEQS